MNIFKFREKLVADYASYVSSFINIKDSRIKKFVDSKMEEGFLWPDPLVQLNPSFEPGQEVEDLVSEGLLHDECRKIFRRGKSDEEPTGKPLRLHRHQEEAIRLAVKNRNYVLTTGTGSGKSLSYIIPIVNYALQRRGTKGIKAIIVYPMNALANSQFNELEKFLCHGYQKGLEPVKFRKYTGQERGEERNAIISDPPDILLTNYVMLELILTRPEEKNLVEAAKGLKFLVFDELHTYRGRQGADVALLIRRIKDLLGGAQAQCVGTSATLAGPGSFDEQRDEVATLARKVFGSEFLKEDIICETLCRSTKEFDFNDKSVKDVLADELKTAPYEPPADFNSFVSSPLCSWIETTFGLDREPVTNRLIRSKAKSIYGTNGSAQSLSETTGIPLRNCEEVLEKCLMSGYKLRNPQTDFPVFAFRLHQFISRGDSVFTSLEPVESRYITLSRQQFVPDSSRSKVLLSLVFNRECGQEYFCVKRRKNKNGKWEFSARELQDRNNDDGSESGFLYFSKENPWPDSDSDEELERLPEDWLELRDDGSFRVKKDRRKYLPEPISVGLDGVEDETGMRGVFIQAPFRFCLSCGVSYDFRQTSDFGKLSSLGSEGRSTATTILCLSTILNLRKELNILTETRKLLSFTDNRQDASLQAGHFNDFVEIGLLRAAIFKATSACGPAGMEYDVLTQKIFESLGLPKHAFMSNPEARFQPERDAAQALRDVIGYRIYQDLRRGWRITAPNLEQCGLLEIKYKSLEDLCMAEDIWQNCHMALVQSTQDERVGICKVLLDLMRRSLAIKSNYLDPIDQSQIKIRSGQHLISPWSLDENEILRHAAIAFPRSRKSDDSEEFIYISPLSRYGRYIRSRAFKSYGKRIEQAEASEIIAQLLKALATAGIVEPVVNDDIPGYQINAASMVWKAGDGTKSFYDPMAMPNAPDVEIKTNKYFVDFYKYVALNALGVYAKEHTAQVQSDIRQEREKLFGDAKLPVLFCSPTMELGIDIKQLNVVNMRNVPPTPANYAQRSGRAGRSGQPALVFTYCTLGSPHDQYFFRHQPDMVSGAVSTPRMDLANEDLVKAHIHAIWLTECRMKLGPSLYEILDLRNPPNPPTLEIKEEKQKILNDAGLARKAKTRGQRLIDDIKSDLDSADWFDDSWLEEVLKSLPKEFDRSCDRWRTIYRSAFKQAELQSKIIIDATKPREEKELAKSLRADAEAQLDLLTKAENVMQSDFYSYRYFASEGFLPGYNFPRLPLSAFIPGRRVNKKEDEFLTRPRFLAITEFGPRSILYHEGSKYTVHRVILPPRSEETNDITTGSVKICTICGYLHPVKEGEIFDKCENCNELLPGKPLSNKMFRLQNVVCKRRERINSDEEERFKLGYEILTSLRFAERYGRPLYTQAEIISGPKKIATLKYGNAAVLWRINLGWKRRAEKETLGFILDTERGYWAKNEAVEDDTDEPTSKRTTRVIPYVEDRRNSLIYEPAESLSAGQFVSLQSALSHAIQAEFQLEDQELACELLPDQENPAYLLFYESAEGGAGVLRRLVEVPGAFAKVAKKALEICHFDPESGTDRKRAPGAKEDCEAACYDCLLSYYNQPLHKKLDRKLALPFLVDLAASTVQASPSDCSREEHFEKLMRLAESGLEKKWLMLLNEKGYALPDLGQHFIKAANCRLDYYYNDKNVAIFIDGPPHDFPEQKKKDSEIGLALERGGHTVIRFNHKDNWIAILKKFPSVFGGGL